MTHLVTNVTWDCRGQLDPNPARSSALIAHADSATTQPNSSGAVSPSLPLAESGMKIKRWALDINPPLSLGGSVKETSGAHAGTCPDHLVLRPWNSARLEKSSVGRFEGAGRRLSDPRSRLLLRCSTPPLMSGRPGTPGALRAIRESSLAAGDTTR